ncbi:MAG: hypothetical protein ACLUQW_02440 [Collinsella sp.]
MMRLSPSSETVEGFIDHVSENRGVAAYAASRSSSRVPRPICSQHPRVGHMQPQASRTPVNEWVYRSLAALDSSDEKAAEQLAESPAIKAELL